MDTSQKYFNSLHDKEHADTQFLNIGVTTAQLLPLLNPVSFLVKHVFYTEFRNVLYWFAGLFQVFANWVTYSNHHILRKFGC